MRTRIYSPKIWIRHYDLYLKHNTRHDITQTIGYINWGSKSNFLAPKNNTSVWSHLTSGAISLGGETRCSIAIRGKITPWRALDNSFDFQKKCWWLHISSWLLVGWRCWPAWYTGLGTLQKEAVPIHQVSSCAFRQVFFLTGLKKPLWRKSEQPRTKKKLIDTGRDGTIVFCTSIFEWLPCYFCPGYEAANALWPRLAL